MAKEVVYWDSNAFLGLLNGEVEKVAPCEDVWAAGEKGHLIIVTSTLTVAEVIYSRGVPKMDPAKRPKVNDFFRAPHIVQKPLTRKIAELARDVVWDCNIQAKDAIHVATAAYYHVGILHTYDDKLLALNLVTINGFNLQIIKPHAVRQLEIPSDTETH